MTQCLWYVGQTGIVLEVIGAGLGVLYAWETYRRWRAHQGGTYDSIGRDVQMPREEFVGQFPKQIKVFGLIAVGLVLQFIGNFAQ